VVRIQPPLHQETVAESDDRRASGAGLLGAESGHAIPERGQDRSVAREHAAIAATDASSRSTGARSEGSNASRPRSPAQRLAKLLPLQLISARRLFTNFWAVDPHRRADYE
jgi:hypothetical protein